MLIRENRWVGIGKAYAWGIPAINMGDRQQNREKGKNVIWSSFASECGETIMPAIGRAAMLGPRLRPVKSHMGTGARIAQFIAERRG